MARGLTVEEADRIAQQARGDDRPLVFVAARNAEELISEEFESWLILTDAGIRSQVANFFQTVIDNDPNNLETRTELLQEFIREEIVNTAEYRHAFKDVTSAYSSTRETLVDAADGFEDVTEVTLLQEAMTSSLGPLAEQNDRYAFNYAALTVLQRRADGENLTNFREELESWIRVLSEYD